MMTAARPTAPRASETETAELVKTGTMTGRGVEHPLPGLSIMMTEMTDDPPTVLPGAMIAGKDGTATETIEEGTVMTGIVAPMDEITATAVIQDEGMIEIEWILGTIALRLEQGRQGS